MIHRSRITRHGRTAGGGFAIVYNTDKIKITERNMNKGGAELLCAVGKMPEIARRIVIIAVYIPPHTRAAKTEEIMNFIRLESDFEDPYVIIAGDFNKMNTTSAFCNYPDIAEPEAGATHGAEALDLVFTNFDEYVTSQEIHSPLETEAKQKSDHMVVAASADLLTYDNFTWKSIRTRPKTGRRDAIF